MGDFIPANEQSNFETFRECLSEPILRALATPTENPKSKKKKKSHSKKGSSRTPTQAEPATTEDPNPPNDAEDLGDFIDYLATLIFTCLPTPLRTLTHAIHKARPTLYSPPLTPSTTLEILTTLSPLALETLSSYSLLPSAPDPTDTHNFFTPLLTTYLGIVSAAPPPWASTRASACELCSRDWIGLTYHHLIPKSVHGKVRKRGWHGEEALGSVAWLCRACHSFVHACASNEELARCWYSVELLLGREDVRAWVAWVGRVRWKAR